MTIEQALASIVDDGINLGAADFVDVEALKVAADVLRKVIAGRLVEPGHEWISVEERMPEDDLPIGSKVKQIKVFVAYKTNGRWVTRTQIRKKGRWYGAPDEWDWIKISDPITHWMPMPEPPK